jgi:hypothetical protein
VHPRDLPPCDLVMRGGATSGLVYPGAVLELSRHYRFENLGGTSAGAIAAAGTAAAEYRRQRDGVLELRGLEEVIAELGQPGFVPSLLQPAAADRPLMDLALRLMSAGRARRRQLQVLAATAISYRPIHAVIATLGAAAILTLLAVGLQHLPVILGVVLALFGAIALMLLGAWAVLAPLGSMLHTAWRELPEQGFGICPGTRPSPGGPAALTDWLHARFQQLAGLAPDTPLTFGMLEEAGIGLKMVGTDLGQARPVMMPFEEEQYLFVPAELRALFPAAVADHVCEAAGVPPEDRDGTRAWFLPGKELPVVVAARLSASVPLLLSALRLYSARPDLAGPVESFISDGGITSNFPVHFFDDWLPRHPTFALDLVPFARSAQPGDAAVWMAGESGSRLIPHWTHASGLFGFLRQIEDASRNWRDQVQAELPGFRERVCQIRMDPGEGGFHLGADPEAVDRLLERGRAGGREILARFDWDQHRFTRYLTLMDLLQQNFRLLAERFGDYSAWLTSGEAEQIASRAGRDSAWCAEAARSTARLIQGMPEAPSFDPQSAAQPEPAMRISSRV